MHATLSKLLPSDFPALTRASLATLQVNLGYLCNQSCLHCHVNAGPTRKELMDAESIDLVLEFLQQQRIQTLDLTGGAPELNPHFRDLVRQARQLGVTVMDRCNLTVLELPEQAGLAEFLAQQSVQIVASLPCYSQHNVDQQRGEGVFEDSIRALKRLNSLGYGQPDSELTLNLVYNPQGASLPPSQSMLEADYKQRLQSDFGVLFNQLFTLANMPIQRFGSTLVSKGEFDDYLSLLRGAYQSQNLDQVMCRTLISVDWRGFVYDCDFNQMLGLAMPDMQAGQTHLRDLLDQSITGRPIAVANHCYGCTAGQGSSCGGSLR